MNLKIRFAAILNNLRLRSCLYLRLFKLYGPILKVDLNKLLWTRIPSSSLGSRDHQWLIPDLVVASLDVRLPSIGESTSISSGDRGPHDEYLGLSP